MSIRSLRYQRRIAKISHDAMASTGETCPPVGPALAFNDGCMVFAVPLPFPQVPQEPPELHEAVGPGAVAGGCVDMADIASFHQL